MLTLLLIQAVAVLHIQKGGANDNGGKAMETCSTGDVDKGNGCMGDGPRKVSERENTAQQCNIAQEMEGLEGGSQYSEPEDMKAILQGVDNPYNFAKPRQGDFTHT